MGLQEVKDDLQKQLDEALKKEEELLKQEEPATEQPAPAPEPEPEPEKKEEQEKAETEHKPEKTPAEYAAERREKRALSEQLQAANERLAALEEKLSAQQKQAEAPAEPDKETDPVGWAEHQIKLTNEKLDRIASVTLQQQQETKRKMQVEAAVQEFTNYENQARAKIKDYDDVRAFYINSVMKSVKVLQPDISNEELGEIVKERFLTRAGQLLRAGYENPVEAMYQEAKSMGYQPQVEEKEESKPDLRKIAANKARNAGMAAASGSGDRGELTRQSAATMTNAEWSRLPAAEKQRLLSEMG